MQTKNRLVLKLLIKMVSLILLATDPPIMKPKEIYRLFHKLNYVPAVAASH